MIKLNGIKKIKPNGGYEKGAKAPVINDSNKYLIRTPLIRNVTFFFFQIIQI